MKKVLTAVFFCLSFFYGSAQLDTATREYVEMPDSTAIGAADGKLSSKVIGATGGKIVSDDGRVELIFPAGALTANTTISIQPTVNLAPSGTGKSYQLEPSGTKFKKPVQFIFHYNDEEAETCFPGLMGFAMQDHKGKWSFMDYQDWDSTTKSLKGVIHHFSGLSNLNKLTLWVGNSPLMVRKKSLVQLIDNSRTYVLEDTVLVLGYGRLRIRDKVEWFVNGVRNGNDKVGTLRSLSSVVRRKYKLTDADYVAPGIMPKENPVTVVAVIYVYTGNQQRLIQIASTKIRVYDMYKVSIIHTREYRAAMGNEVTDSANCSIIIYPNPDRIFFFGLNNYPPSLTKVGRGVAGCKLKIDPSNALGSINISEGYKYFKISDDYPNEVSFEFLSGYEHTDFWFWWECPRARVNTPRTAMPGMPVAPEINFLANGREQTINTQTPTEKYKVIVRPIRE